MEDNQIIDLFWNRSEHAIAETSRKYGAYCHTIAYNILENHEDAEECLNDTYLRAWNAIPPQRPNRLAAYLGKITRNLSLDILKRSRAEKRGFGQTALLITELEECIAKERDPVAEAADEKALAACISNFLYGLPEIKRRVFMLRYWYAMPIKDVVIQTGMSESKLTSMLFRTRKELKIYLKQEGIFW